jgi:hypothetical protein
MLRLVTSQATSRFDVSIPGSMCMSPMSKATQHSQDLNRPHEKSSNACECRNAYNPVCASLSLKACMEHNIVHGAKVKDMLCNA